MQNTKRLAATGILLAVAAVGGPVAHATADTVSTGYYGTPGTYTVVIPPHTTSVQIYADGAAGGAGGSNAIANGGAGGRGADVNATIPIGGSQSSAKPGDVLAIVVGAVGGGGRGGAGDAVGGHGGAGGGAGIVYDTSGYNVPLVSAAGGGGGGGAGGAFFGYDGGSGGNAPYGSAGLGFGAGGGGPVATHGSRCGTSLPYDVDLFKGESANSAPSGSDAGGGGGAGDGVCGGYAGNPGGGGGGGGGGGIVGDSRIAPEGSGSISQNQSDTSGVSMTFTRAPVEVQITSPASFSIGVLAGSFHTTVAASGFPAPTFSLSGAPPWVSIDRDTGLMTGTFPARTAGAFTFTVNASNGAGSSVAQTFTLQVSGPPLAITTAAALPGATVGQAYSTTLLSTGGIGAVTWHVSYGALPAGLTLSSAGVISGSPTQPGTSSFTVQGLDSQIPAPASITKTVKLVVAPRVLAITTTALPSATVGKPYAKTLTAALGTAPYRFSVSSGSLPAGIKLSSGGDLSGTPTTPGTSSVKFKVTDARRATATVTLALAVVPGVQPALYVLNTANSNVNAFSPFAGGNVAPLSTLAGSNTTLSGLGGVVIDATGRVYVSSVGTPSIVEFPYGSKGNSAPVTTIKGAATGLATPMGLALDDAGRLYVADPAANAITVYAAGASGNAAPLTTLAGEHTGLASPNAVAIDGDGYLWVANTAANTLTKYNPAATGDTQPLATITGLSGPQAIAIDDAGNLLVANTYASSIAEYSSKASGNAAPARTIAGALTGLRFPQGVDIDSSGDIWVGNDWANSVTEYAPSASGNAPPMATISGALTGLAAPASLAVAPPLSIAMAKLPAARRGRPYRTLLKADLGTTPYRWTGRLPHGLRLSSNGRIAGRATKLGTFRFTVRVTDATRKRHMTATRRLTLRVRR